MGGLRALACCFPSGINCEPGRDWAEGEEMTNSRTSKFLAILAGVLVAIVFVGWLSMNANEFFLAAD
jgi:hypothetical protein